MGSRSAATSLPVDIDGDRAVVRIPRTHFGTPDDGSADQPLLRLVHELSQSHLLLDFEAVDFLSSLGLATLLAVHKHMRVSGGRLKVVNVRPHIYEVFAVTRLTTVLDVFQMGAA
jgi:anti-sigma B factor antagonist